jgi:hypothetical protein
MADWDSIEDMPDVIWALQYGPGLGGRWLDIEPTADMFVYADGYKFEPYTKYVKDEQRGEIFAWRQIFKDPDPFTYLRGPFRLERREAINQTVGYRKAE